MVIPKASADHYLEIYRRALPENYAEALDTIDDGLGMDLPAAMAKIMELADCASNRGTQATFLRSHSDQSDVPAAGLGKATGTLIVRRRGWLSGEARIAAGTLIEAFRTDSFGQEEVIGIYIATQSLVFADSVDTELSLTIEAVSPGYSGNVALGAAQFRFAEQSKFTADVVVQTMATLLPVVPDASTAIFSDTQIGAHFYLEALPMVPPPLLDVASNLSELRRITAVAPPAVSPPHSITFTPLMDGADDGRLMRVHLLTYDDLFLLEQTADITGGNGGMLDDRGAEALASRLDGESDEAMAERLESQQDAVSPDAVVRAIDAMLSPHGIAWRFLETGDPQGLGGFVWDLHPYDWGSISFMRSDADIYQVQGAVWLSESQTRRFFVVAVASSIESVPLLASKLWQRINQVRARGVSFRLVIDPGL